MLVSSLINYHRIMSLRLFDWMQNAVNFLVVFFFFFHRASETICEFTNLENWLRINQKLIQKTSWFYSDKEIKQRLRRTDNWLHFLQVWKKIEPKLKYLFVTVKQVKTMQLQSSYGGVGCDQCERVFPPPISELLADSRWKRF
jgi:hypothetical protein